MTNQTILTDLHTHTTFSPDGNHTFDEMCQQALNIGLKAIAFTEHAEWHRRQRGFPRVAAYFKALQRCQQQYEPLGLRVYSGVELGNPHVYHQQAHQLLQQYNFDIVISSLHYLYDINIHSQSCFDGRDPQQVFHDYFLALAEVADSAPCNIIAHFDRILWRATLLGIPFNPHYHETVIRQAMNTIAAHNQALELNTKHLADTLSWHDALITILRWFREEGGQQITVNSDAHYATHIGRNFNIAQGIISAAGFDASHLFHPNRKAQATKHLHANTPHK